MVTQWAARDGTIHDLMSDGPAYPTGAGLGSSRESYSEEIEAYHAFARAKEALQDEIAHARYLARRGLLLDHGITGSDPRAVAWRSIHADNLTVSLRRIDEMRPISAPASYETLVELAAVARRIEASCVLLSQSLGTSSVSLVRS